MMKELEKKLSEIAEKAKSAGKGSVSNDNQ